MTFQVFTNRRARRSNRPTMTLTARGFLSLSRAAHEALNSPKAVELLYDRDHQTIGFRAADPDHVDAFPVRASAGKKTFTIAGRAFASHYDIPLGEARRWPAQMGGDVLSVDISKPGAPVTSNRARS